MIKRYCKFRIITATKKTFTNDGKMSYSIFNYYFIRDVIILRSIHVDDGGVSLALASS